MGSEDKRLKRKVRSSYFISTVSIAMVLFLLGSVSFLIVSALDATDRLRESVTIYVMLDDGLTDEQTAGLKKQMEAKEIVREVVYVAKEDAAAKFIAETNEDFTGFIDFNPLPDSFEVGLHARSSERDLIREFDRDVSAMPGVREVVYQRGVVERIGANINKFNLILLLFGGTLLAISLILLNNTIRMNIVAKRQIINTMQLVGATKGFIMRPFLGSATLHGIYAGLIATAMFAGMIFGLREKFPEVALTADNILLIAIAGSMIVGGILISLLFTAFSVGKFVRMPSAKSYMY